MGTGPLSLGESLPSSWMEVTNDYVTLLSTDVRPKVKTELEDLMRQQVVDLFPARRQSRASIGNISKPKKIKFKAITNRSMQWPNLSQNHRLAVLMPVKKARLNAMCDLLKERPISRKATLIHDEVIRTRDLCFEVHVQYEYFTCGTFTINFVDLTDP